MNVSVYVPCFNAVRTVGVALDSLLRQTHRPDEVILVDDGSTDGSAMIAEQFPVRVVRHQQNRGLGAARNTGLRAAKHGLVASIDADCRASPLWLASLFSHMTEQRCVGVGGRLIEQHHTATADAWRSVHMRQDWGATRQQNPRFLFGCNTLFRRDVVLAAGGYQEHLRTNFEDVDLSQRLLRENHDLVYEPAAEVQHLRRDSIPSLLSTYWRWSFHDWSAPSTLWLVAHRFAAQGTRLGGYLREDLREVSWRLAALDAAIPWHCLALDILWWCRRRRSER
ncbi:glycosyltransferase [Planctomycetota bacterium]